MPFVYPYVTPDKSATSVRWLLDSMLEGSHEGSLIMRVGSRIISPTKSKSNCRVRPKSQDVCEGIRRISDICGACAS